MSDDTASGHARTYRLMQVDLRTHVIHRLGGEETFFGHPFDAHGNLGPDALLGCLHPDDQGSLMQILEGCLDLRAGQTMRASTRYRHAKGHWTVCTDEIRPVEWNADGLVTMVEVDVEIEDWPEGEPPPMGGPQILN